jgi:UDP-N-acetylmuramate--alanine ligase
MTHYHVIGIGGAGMSAIAHILLDQGHTVSGCDQQANRLTRELESRGATIHAGHEAAHLDGVEIVATSSALRADHPELIAARARGIPIQKRADLWREWSIEKPTLAIAGTHGKTTTTAMCAVIMTQLGHDPAYIVPAGGPVPGLERFARWGSGPFVIEADEYDRLFLGLIPTVSIITSVDWDHVDVYPTRDSAEQAFAQFARQTTQTIVACSDDPGARRLTARDRDRLAAQVVTYGLTAGAEWLAGDVHSAGGMTHFTVMHEGNAHESSIDAAVRAPGRHNAQNALGAALGVMHLLGESSPAPMLESLRAYRGAARRFEIKGAAAGVTVVDDYAHNPPKVRAALQAARMQYPQRRVVAYLQPHTFSRTAALIDEWAGAFGDADVLLIGDIYRSRERPEDFPGIDAAYLASRIERPNAIVSGGIEATVDRFMTVLQPGDVLLTMGAGDGHLVGERVLERLTA